MSSMYMQLQTVNKCSIWVQRLINFEIPATCGRRHNWVRIPGRSPYVIPRGSAGWNKMLNLALPFNSPSQLRNPFSSSTRGQTSLASHQLVNMTEFDNIVRLSVCINPWKKMCFRLNLARTRCFLAHSQHLLGHHWNVNPGWRSHHKLS